jgi:putative toxin-antitoxin system antitoxin component (TIGR02293 family)
MKRAKKRPLPSTRQYDSDDGPLTDARHAATKSAVEKAHGRTRQMGKEIGRAERLSRILAIARYVWDSDDNALSFLTTPNLMLRNRSPLDVSTTEPGARRVEQLLWKLYFGIAA